MPDLTTELEQQAYIEPANARRYFFSTGGVTPRTYIVPVARRAEWDAWVLAWETHYEGTPEPPLDPPVGMQIDNLHGWTFAFPKENRYG
jgi:hypothetical protein